MRHHQSLATILACATLAWSGQSVDQRMSYSEAFARATANTSTPSGHQYETTQFTPYYQEHSGRTLQECFAHVQSPDTARFTFVVKLDARGRPQGFWVDRNTNIARC